MKVNFRKYCYPSLYIFSLILPGCEGLLNSQFLGDTEQGTLALTIDLPDKLYDISLLVSVTDTAIVFYFPDKYYDPVISPSGKRIILHDLDDGTPDASALVIYSWDNHSMINLKDKHGRQIYGDKVIWSPDEDRIYFDMPGSYSWYYAYFDFNTDSMVIYNGLKPADDFIDKNTILTTYKDENGYYHAAKMDREGNIISNLPNPHLNSPGPNLFLEAGVLEYSRILNLFLGIYKYTTDGRKYYGIMLTNESGSVYTTLTDDSFIDLNPIFGYKSQYIYFERLRDILVDPDHNNWIMKLDLRDNKLQTFLPNGALGGARNLYIMDYSDKIILR